MKPGATGAAVDAAARKAVLASGFAAYQHVTGHPIGVAVHDAGSLLAPDWKERYGARVLRKLEETQLYAVEPTVSAHDRATKSEISIGLEEDVVIGADGAKYLGIPQAELILIR
jgi:Xaa-Pro aminopeptidase